MNRDRSLVTLGVNQNHDASAAIAINGRLVSAVAAERLVRTKHTSQGARMAVDYVLSAAGLTIDGVDLVVECNHHDQSDGGPGQNELARYLQRADQYLVHPSHHELHAASTFLTSPFKRSHVIVIDGKGSPNRPLRPAPKRIRPQSTDEELFECESFFEADERAFRLHAQDLTTHLTAWPQRESIGVARMYNYVSKAIFSTRHDAGKTMALASFGDAAGAPPFVRQGPHGLSIDTQTLFGEAEIARTRNYMDNVDIAARAQSDLENYVLEWIRRATHNRSNSAACFAGGTFLNCPTNRRIIDELGYENTWFFPASTDDGIAIGGALLGHSVVLGGDRVHEPFSPFLGNTYTDDAILRAIGAVEHEYGMKLKRQSLPEVGDTIPLAADLISKGQVIGWFQGGSEVGPRALGNRSLLADPRTTATRDRINSKIKHREPFRPVAPAVLTEHAHRYFEDSPSDASRWMLTVASVRPEVRDIVPGVVHVDGTARYQTVEQADNALFHALISEFYRLTGCPMLINTSLNLPGEPLVESPRDALENLLRTPMDALVMGRHIVTGGAP